MSENTTWHPTEKSTTGIFDAFEKLDMKESTDGSSVLRTHSDDVQLNTGGLDIKNIVVSPSADPADELVTNEKHEWRETWVRIGPLSGLFALVIAFSSTIAALGILIGSNHTLVDTWPTLPSTFIAIFTAIGNFSIRHAAIQGVIVAWWIQALRGSTVSDLHYKWRAGTSLHGAVMAGRRMGKFGIASIFSCILVLLDGPLLQRASTVTTTMHEGPEVQLQTVMAPEIPTDYTGAWVAGTDELRWSSAFNQTIPSPTGNVSNSIFSGAANNFWFLAPLWGSSEPLSGAISGCAGQCRAQLIAPALATTSCRNFKQPIDYEVAWAFKDAFDTKYAPPAGHESFIIATALDTSGKTEQINALTAYTPTRDCTDGIEYTICSLESAVGEYNITIENDQLSLDPGAHPRIIGIANNTAVNRTLGPDGFRLSTLAGIVAGAHVLWDSNVYAARVNGSTSVSGNGAHSTVLFQRGTFNGSDCPAYYNPREQYMASLNKLMVYLGFYAAQGISNPRLDTLYPGLVVNATITGHVTGKRSVFRTEYRFFAGAAFVELLCICLIAPTYWGWWRIGRAVSLSPLEIAKAFEAPTLSHIDSNASALQIARSCGDQPIRYGVTTTGSTSNTKLVFSNPNAIIWPRRGCLLDG